jgi:hypothetical protein
LRLDVGEKLKQWTTQLADNFEKPSGGPGIDQPSISTSAVNKDDKINGENANASHAVHCDADMVLLGDGITPILPRCPSNPFVASEDENYETSDSEADDPNSTFLNVPKSTTSLGTEAHPLSKEIVPPQPSPPAISPPRLTLAHTEISHDTLMRDSIGTEFTSDLWKALGSISGSLPAGAAHKETLPSVLHMPAENQEVSTSEVERVDRALTKESNTKTRRSSPRGPRPAPESFSQTSSPDAAEKVKFPATPPRSPKISAQRSPPASEDCKPKKAVRKTPSVTLTVDCGKTVALVAEQHVHVRVDSAVSGETRIDSVVSKGRPGPRKRHAPTSTGVPRSTSPKSPVPVPASPTKLDGHRQASVQDQKPILPPRPEQRRKPSNPMPPHESLSGSDRSSPNDRPISCCTNARDGHHDTLYEAGSSLTVETSTATMKRKGLVGGLSHLTSPGMREELERKWNMTSSSSTVVATSPL